MQETPCKGGVNIIGASPLDYWDKRQISSMIHSLEIRGLKINGVWGMDDKLESIKNALAAEVNLVVSYSGLKAAKWLKNKFNMPFVSGVPLGGYESERIARNLKDFLRLYQKIQSEKRI